MFQDTLLIIKWDYLGKRRPLLLHLLERGFLIKGQRKICFSPELAAEFYQDMSEDRCFMFQVILLSKGNSEAFILCKENAVEDLLNTMVCYFGTSLEMEQNVHVTKCYNKVQREISFIFPNYIYEPIECPDQIKFCMNNNLVESTIEQLYDIITKPEIDPHKTWKQKLAEFLLLSNKNIPRISNQCCYNKNLMAEEIAQQTKISCLSHKTEQKQSFSDLDLSSPAGSSVVVSTSSCVSCSPFSSGAECMQQMYQQKAYNDVIKARTVPLSVKESSSSSKIGSVKDTLHDYKAEEIVGEEEDILSLEKETVADVNKAEIAIIDSTGGIFPSPPAEDDLSLEVKETGAENTSAVVTDKENKPDIEIDQSDVKDDPYDKEEAVEKEGPSVAKETSEIEGIIEPVQNVEAIPEELAAESNI